MCLSLATMSVYVDINPPRQTSRPVFGSKFGETVGSARSGVTDDRWDIMASNLRASKAQES